MSKTGTGAGTGAGKKTHPNPPAKPTDKPARTGRDARDEEQREVRKARAKLRQENDAREREEKDSPRSVSQSQSQRSISASPSLTYTQFGVPETSSFDPSTMDHSGFLEEWKKAVTQRFSQAEPIASDKTYIPQKISKETVAGILTESFNEMSQEYKRLKDAAATKFKALNEEFSKANIQGKAKDAHLATMVAYTKNFRFTGKADARHLKGIPENIKKIFLEWDEAAYAADKQYELMKVVFEGTPLKTQMNKLCHLLRKKYEIQEVLPTLTEQGQVLFATMSEILGTEITLSNLNTSLPQAIQNKFGKDRKPLDSFLDVLERKMREKYPLPAREYFAKEGVAYRIERPTVVPREMDEYRRDRFVKTVKDLPPAYEEYAVKNDFGPRKTTTTYFLVPEGTQKAFHAQLKKLKHVSRTDQLLAERTKEPQVVHRAESAPRTQPKTEARLLNASEKKQIRESVERAAERAHPITEISSECRARADYGGFLDGLASGAREILRAYEKNGDNSPSGDQVLHAEKILAVIKTEKAIAEQAKDPKAIGVRIPECKPETSWEAAQANTSKAFWGLFSRNVDGPKDEVAKALGVFNFRVGENQNRLDGERTNTALSCRTVGVEMGAILEEPESPTIPLEEEAGAPERSGGAGRRGKGVAGSDRSGGARR